MIRTAVAPDQSLCLQVFLYLQALDVLTTWSGLRLGFDEASPFVRLLMEWGPMEGLLASKVIALLLGAFCVWSRRFGVIRLINYWFAALVSWNVALIGSSL